MDLPCRDNLIGRSRRGWTNTARLKPSDANNSLLAVLALSPLLTALLAPIRCTIRRTQNTLLKFRDCQRSSKRNIFANRLLKNFEPITLTETGNNQSPRGLFPKTSSERQISNQSEEPGFPDPQPEKENPAQLSAQLKRK